LRSEHLARLEGTRQRVLVEGPGERGGYTGRTERNEIVHLLAARDLTGEVVEVEISRALKHSLQGTPTAPGLAAPSDAAFSVEQKRAQCSTPTRVSPRSLPLLH
jgi:tRNA-2-methylthio-N6-dimethylallyladenosine synthase